VRVGEDAEFQVHTENAGEAEPKVVIMGPGGVNEKFTVKKVINLSYECFVQNITTWNVKNKRNC